MSSALVKINNTDTNADFLQSKMVSQDSTVSFSEVLSGGQKKLNLSIPGGSSALFHYVDLYSNGETLGDGTVRTLSSLGYTAGTAATAWPLTNAAYGIAVATDTIDWVAWQEACLTMAAQPWTEIQSLENRSYQVNKKIILPDHQLAWSANMRSLMFIFKMNGSRINITGNSESVLYRLPPDQATATGSGYNDYRFIFCDSLITGSGTGQTGITLGATNGSELRNIHFKDLSTGFDSQFNLHCLITHPFLTGCTSYGMRLRVGQWSGASNTTAQSNAPVIILPRIYSASSQVAGIELSAVDTFDIISPSCEGFGGGYYFLIDTLNSSTVRFSGKITNLRFELSATATKPTAIVRLASNRCMAVIEWGMCQVDPSLGSVTLIENESTGTGLANYIITKNLHVNPNGNCVFKNITAGFQAGIFDVYNHQLVNTTLSNSANWDTTGGGSIPPGSNLRLIPLLP